MRYFLMALGGLVLLWPVAGQAQTTRLMIVGDSWAEEQWVDGSHVRVFGQQGWSEIGVYGNSTTDSGSTAFDWKQTAKLQLIDQALANHPTIDTIQLTVGGNDFLNAWSTAMSPEQVDTLTLAILFDLGLIIDYILGRDPSLEIVLSLYDYPNFRDTLGGLGGWFACEPRWQAMGQPSPLDLNQVAVGLVESIAAIAQHNPRVHFVDHFGLMQYTYGWPDEGIPPHTLLPPGDISQPSPHAAMRRHFWGAVVDCFHLRADGYDVIVANLVDQFFNYRFAGTAEVVLADYEQVYNGSAAMIPVSTFPPGLEMALTYNDESEPPIDSGSYVVTAMIDQPGWAGAASATLTITPAPQAIEFAPLGAVYQDHPPIFLTASADSGLPPVFRLISGPALIDSGSLVLDGTPGVVTVGASQPGNANWQSTDEVVRELEVLERVDRLHQDRFEWVPYGSDSRHHSFRRH